MISELDGIIGLVSVPGVAGRKQFNNAAIVDDQAVLAERRTIRLHRYYPTGVNECVNVLRHDEKIT